MYRWKIFFLLLLMGHCGLSSAYAEPIQEAEIQDCESLEQPLRVPLRAIVCALEIAKFGKAKRHKGLLPRIERLERKVYGHADYIQREKQFNVRISELVEKIEPNKQQIDEGFKICQDRIFEESRPNWFTNPPDVEWMNKLGRGVKRSGTIAKESAGSTKRVLTSPEFITLVGAAAAIVGAYYIGRSMNRGGASSGANPDHEYVQGHWRGGTWVPGYWRTKGNYTTLDNFGTKGNWNPYTGQWGTKVP